MPAVTIQGEMRSRAPEIGKQVADRLYAGYFDSDIAARVAQQAGSSEREVEAKELPTRFLTRLAEAAGSSFIYEAATLPSDLRPLTDLVYLSALTCVMEGLANGRSAVICGRGGQFILRDYPDVLRTPVVAPLEIRLRGVMEDAS